MRAGFPGDPVMPSTSTLPWTLREYARLVSSPRFVLLVLASGIPFNGMFLYVLAAPGAGRAPAVLAPTQFFWFFCCTIGGIRPGAAGWAPGSARSRRRRRSSRFQVMVVISMLNIGLNPGRR